MTAPHSGARARQPAEIQQRADILRGVALGMTLAHAARAAGSSISAVNAWKAQDQLFGAALDAVSTMADAQAAPPRSPMTDEQTEAFLAALRNGETVEQATARVGLSPSIAYRHRRRDHRFAELMQQAQTAGMEARAERRRRKRAPFRAMRYRLVRMAPDGQPARRTGEPAAGEAATRAEGRPNAGDTPTRGPVLKGPPPDARCSPP